MKTGFFDYFNRAKAEGMTDTEAYRWAITEDMYDAEDRPIPPDQATADGMCHHPQFAAKVLSPVACTDLHSTEVEYVNCEICGTFLVRCWPVPRGGMETCVWWAPPVKIATRSEYAANAVKALGEDKQ